MTPKAVFARERRRRALARIVSSCARSPTTSPTPPSFEEVVAALGRTSEHDLGVPGDPARLDRRHRPPQQPASSIATSAPPPTCVRAGSGSPPPAGAARRCRRSTSTMSDLHFVKERSPPRLVARAHGDVRASEARVRDAYRTELGAEQGCGCATSRQAGTERESLPRARAARPRAARADPALRRVVLRAARDVRRGLGLPRQPRARRAALSAEMAQRWFMEEYQPGRADAARAEAGGAGSGEPSVTAPRDAALPAPAHLRVGRRILERLLGAARASRAARSGTMVHQFLKELR